MPEKSIEKRKKAIIKWIKENKIFILILAFGIFLRLYYFSLTYNQPLWWDEADYLAFAKNIAGLNSDWIVTAQHNSIFPYLVAVFFMLNLSEAVAKFFLEIIPSILLIVITYYLAIKMYADKRIALITSFLMVVFWAILFNSMRFHLGVPALLTALLAIFIFWQGYEKKEKIFGKINSNWAIPLTVALVTLTYTIRRGYFIFGFFILFYMLSTRKIKDLVKEKYNWIALAIFIGLVIIAETLIFTVDIGSVASTYSHFDQPINLLALDVFESYFSFGNIFFDILFYLFWIGFIFLILRLGLYLGNIRSSKDTSIRSDLFNVLTIILTLAYFTLFLRTQHIFGEPRWYFPLLFSTFICISRASLHIGDYIKKYNKFLGIALIVILIGFGGYLQIVHADSIIKSKAETYSGIKEAGLLLNKISSEADVIVSQPLPQMIYYSERIVLQPEVIAEVEKDSEFTLDEFLNGLERNPEAKYLIVSFSEPGQQIWMSAIYGEGGKIFAWEIPFMDTLIDFANQKQNIKKSKTFDDEITFNLIDIKQDIFIYEIVR